MGLNASSVATTQVMCCLHGGSCNQLERQLASSPPKVPQQLQCQQAPHACWGCMCHDASGHTEHTNRQQGTKAHPCLCSILHLCAIGPVAIPILPCHAYAAQPVSQDGHHVLRGEAPHPSAGSCDLQQLAPSCITSCAGSAYKASSARRHCVWGCVLWGDNACCRSIGASLAQYSASHLLLPWQSSQKCVVLLLHSQCRTSVYQQDMSPTWCALPSWWHKTI
jgi:hypothetical protein